MLPARFLMLSGLIVVAALSRLIPHPYNFSPIGAMALFGGACFVHKRWGLLIPLAAMFLSDVLLYSGPYQGFTGQMFSAGLFVYGAFALIFCLGLWLRRRRNPLNVFGATLAASLLFFLISNFGTWLGSGMYPHTAEGLLTCYLAGIPFFEQAFGSPLLNTVLGDLTYSTALFGCLALAEHKWPSLQGLGTHAAQRAPSA